MICILKESYTRGDIDHSYAGAKYICAFADQTGDKKIKKAARRVARTIVSHHGLHDWLDDEGNDYFSERIAKEKWYGEVLENVSSVVSESELLELLKAAGEEQDVLTQRLKAISSREEEYAFYSGLLERLMQSVLIDADRTNTANFMSDSRTEQTFDTASLWDRMHAAMEETLSAFADRKDRISLQRKSISERCRDFAARDAGICQLVVPTGGGKTLSSLRYAIEYCRRCGLEKIIYAAPFMSILEQNSREIRRIAGEENFLEHHSNYRQKTETEEELLEYEQRTEKWDKPVIATTMVQLLNALFSGESASVRRMHRLSRAVLIIDEVQSLPLKCTHLFNLAMNFLSRVCGSTIVLCTATQPDFSRSDYRLMLDEKPSMTGDYGPDFEVFRRTELIPHLTKNGDTYETAADFCFEKYLENRSLLVIVNTKAAAASLYRLLKEKNDAVPETERAVMVHLSTRMCPAHRTKCIEEIRRLLDVRRNVICVTTQLIEAGVDISFGCVVRSLAGLDHAAQAAGRCNRHGEREGVSPVYLIYLREENLGSLKEIIQGQAAARQLINSGQIADYLSADTMTLYFRRFYTEIMAENKLLFSYPAGKTDSSLLNLLSLNKNRWMMKKRKTLRFCGQAFRTAGTLFEVISNQTTDVIVPYNEEAERIISELNSDVTPNRALELLRKAQAYTVSLYDGEQRKLAESSAVYALKNGGAALERGYYDEECGVTLEGGLREVLMF